ncbi:MAG: Ig-like domain-containing protein, partial [Ilumatobacteraceae bacterium]
MTQVALSKDTLTLVLGKTGTLTATPKAADGTALERAVSWSVLDTTVATVTTDGVVSTAALVTAKKVGATTLTATSEGKSRSAVVQVVPAPVATVAVTPATATVVIGRTLQLSAVPKDAEGNALGGRTITWTSSDPTKATVSSAGLVTGQARGVVTIRATSEGVVGEAEVTVAIPVASVTVTPATAALVQPGQTVQLTAVPKDADGNTLTRDVLWSSSNGLIAAVNATGLVTATGSGTVTILATSDGVSGTATITAAGGGTSSGGTIAAIATLPSSLALVSGETGSFAFRPTDASGTVVVQTGGATFATGPEVTTQTQVTSGTVTCGTNGLCTQPLTAAGVAAGAAPVAVPLLVRSTTGGADGTVRVTVVGSVADSLVAGFVPASVTGVPTVAVGDTVTVRAVLYSAAGAALAQNARFSLLVGSGTLAAECRVGWGTGTGPGLVPGGCVKVVPSATGSVKVVAALTKLGGGEWADTVEFTAGNVQVNTVTVEPGTVTLGAGQSATLAAVLKDDFNNTLTGRIVTWSSSDQTIATVSATGVVTALKPGTTTILAQSGSKLGSATVTVVS